MIYCVITGRTYRSALEAAEKTGVSLPTAMKSIRNGQAIVHRSFGVHTWLISPITPELKAPIDRRTRNIKCVTTGVEYDTISKAASEHDIDKTALSRAIRLGKPIWSKTMDRYVDFVRI